LCTFDSLLCERLWGMIMELKDLHYFCLTAETEHVTKAAEKLGVAQPYLTKVINHVEEELGVKLFDKVGRQIRLNSYGQAFYVQAKKVLSCMDNLYTEMDYLLDRQSRNITLLSNTEAYTPGLIANFTNGNTKYGLSLFYSSTSGIIEALKTGEADFALSCPPIASGLIKGVNTDIAFYDVGWILLPPDHPLLKKKVIDFHELDGESLVTSPSDSAIRWKVEPIYEDYGMEMNIVCESNNLYLATQAVQSGMGYAFMPSLYLNSRPELYQYSVEVYAPQEERQSYFGFSYKESSMDNRNARHFRDFAISYFNELQKQVNYTRTSEIPVKYGIENKGL
jgi:DNA-binding transcriptional LysR family regulator